MERPEALDNYSLEYFINKFNEIPEEYYSLTTELNPTDAWEWCNVEEAECLYYLIKPFGILIQVNDGEDNWVCLGASPKARVIKFLEFVKRNRTPYLYRG